MPSVKELFKKAIDLGMKNDVRSIEEIQFYLAEQKEKYEELSDKKKEYFDLDHLTNPYVDSKIFHLENTKVKKIIIGIDVESAELLAVNEYNNKNHDKKIDAVLAHHPEGKALIDLTSILKTVQTSVDLSFGVPVNQVEKLGEERIGKLSRGLSPVNYNKSVSIAKLLDIPFFGIHTPADNMCYTFIKNLVEENSGKIKKLKDIIELLEELPEMQISKKNGIGPQIWSGTPESSSGKIAIAGITGGTSGSKDIYEKYAQAGIGTILVMHISEDHLKEAKKHNINVIMTDHMASDSLGLNLIADEFEKMGVEIMDFSGFTRISRVKK